MALSIHTPELEFFLDSDIYRMQRRPLHRQIVVNDDYRGIRAIDLQTGEEVVQSAFSDRYDESGIIHAWCFRADGEAVVVFNEDSRTACWLSLAPSGPVHDVDCSVLQSFTDLRYFWEGDSFWLTSGKFFGFFKLQWQDEGLLKFVAAEGKEARDAHRAWCRALDRIPLYRCNVERVEPDLAQLLFHDFSEPPGRVGLANWHDGIDWVATAPAEVLGLAFSTVPKGLMFIQYDHKIDAIDRQGQIETSYPVPEGFRYIALDVVPRRADDPAALVAVCSAQTGPILSRVSVYPL